MTLQDAQKEIDKLREMLRSHCIDLQVTFFEEHQGSATYLITDQTILKAVEQQYPTNPRREPNWQEME
jgi:hypothetical protein